MNNLKAIKRENASSGSTNKLRATGFIPAILYGGRTPNQKISIQKKDVKNIINSETFLSQVLEIEIDGKKEKVLPRDVAYHVISEEPIHIDFMRIVTGKKIIIEVPVKFINENSWPGLKQGGVISIVRHEVELKTPVSKIPEFLEANLDNLEIGDSIHISSISLENGVEPTIKDRDFTIATIAPPTVMKVEEEKPISEEESASESEESTTDKESKEESENKTESSEKKDAEDKKS